ncbi:hypothetical protein [Burkholderia gladioli]|uniref:hypothetical protein n=1 Tax=Burkholderia gladioli TaxID=28095 RepID=UPI00163E4670|nr:hypothetical protein [Burkholderia gladioli]
MATLTNTAMVNNMAVLERGMMIIESEQSTDHAFAALFRAAGWEVVAAPAQALRYQPDLLLRKGKVSYVADVKAASESRADRASPCSRKRSCRPRPMRVRMAARARSR